MPQARENQRFNVGQYVFNEEHGVGIVVDPRICGLPIGRYNRLVRTLKKNGDARYFDGYGWYSDLDSGWRSASEDEERFFIDNDTIYNKKSRHSIDFKFFYVGVLGEQKMFPFVPPSGDKYRMFLNDIDMVMKKWECIPDEQVI